MRGVIQYVLLVLVMSVGVSIVESIIPTQPIVCIAPCSTTIPLSWVGFLINLSIFSIAVLWVHINMLPFRTKR